MVQKRLRFLFVLALTALLAFATVGAAHAAKGGNAAKTGGGGGKGGNSTASGDLSLRMVVDQNGDGLPNWNDQITFDVSASVSYPMVNLHCLQGTKVVDNQDIGFYPGWPWSKVFTLSHWYYWPSGAADCTATLYYQTTKGDVTLKAISVPVGD